MRLRTESGDADERPFWQQTGWQMSAAFLILIISAGLVTVLTGMTRSADPVVALVIDGPRANGAGPARPQGCRTDDSDQAVPARPPDDVSWTDLNGGKVPLSPSAGPLHTGGPLLWCFAHTPAGAVMAATVIPRQLSGTGWRPVTAQQVVPGVTRDIFEAVRSSDTGAAPLYTSVSLAGFAIETYTAEEATVRLLLRETSAGYGTTDYTVQWDGGDWKIRPLADGSLHTPVTTVAALAGFVLWKGSHG